MNTDLDKLKDTILKTNTLDDEKEVRLQLLDNIEKELTKLNFRLERALKEKNTLSSIAHIIRSMPGRSRPGAPGVLQHVIIRGIEHRGISRDNTDHNELLKRLGRLLPATKTVWQVQLLIYLWTSLFSFSQTVRSA